LRSSQGPNLHPPGAIRGGFLLLPDVSPAGSRLCRTLLNFKELSVSTHLIAGASKVRLAFHYVGGAIWR
jgi:hypothetical protein